MPDSKSKAGYALIIDTAFETCQVGLAKDGVLIAQKRAQSGGGHDRVLAGMVESILQAHDIHVQMLEKIIVTTGPGRFTGLRVGIAFARGLALVRDLPIIGVNTMDAIEIDLRRSGVVTDAAVIVTVKRGESFIRPINAPSSAIEACVDDALIQTLRAYGIKRLGGVITPVVENLLREGGIAFFSEVTEPSLGAILQMGQQDNGKALIIRPYYAV